MERDEELIVPEPNEELPESWFAAKVHVSDPPASLPPAPPPERSFASTFALGGLAGAAGGLAAIVLAGRITHGLGPAVDVAQAVGRGVGHGSEIGFVIAAAVGALLGGLLAFAMRHARFWIGRVIFASTVSVALWFCAHVALLARHHATLPLVPMLIGVAVYGACVAVVPSSRR